MSYDEDYQKTKNLFGEQPEKILVNYADQIRSSLSTLDIGTGQGRNALYLAEKGSTVIAIDPSAVAIAETKRRAKETGLDIECQTVTFEKFESTDDSCSAILLFGLIQILTVDQIKKTLEKTGRLLAPEGLLFVTAFTVEDDRYPIHSHWKTIGRNSFKSEKGVIRTYLERGELTDLLTEYEPLHYWEGIGPEHRHGDSPPERHAMVEGVFKRN